MGRDLTIDTVTPAELSPDELTLWAGFVRADARFASPYFHPQFTRIAGEVAPGAAVSILHSRGRIVGFFPHQRRGAAAQPIGAPLNDYHAVITAPDVEIPLERVPDLIGAASLNVNGWTGAGGGEGVMVRTTLQADLSAGWTAYDAERRAAFGKYFKDKDRARRSLERDMGPAVVRTDGRDPARLDRLIAGPPGGGGGGGGRGATGGPWAWGWGLSADRHYHFWLPAYEAAAARYSPGIQLSLDTMRQGAAEGFAVFDYGFEGEPYKKYFCNRSRTVLEGVAHRSGLADAVTAAFAMAGAEGALAAGERLANAGLALSVRRRWAAIDACETTVLGRARGIAAAAAAALNKTRASTAASALAAMTMF